jgi:aspartate kinase
MALIVQKFGGDALGDKGKGKRAESTDLTLGGLVVEKFRRVAEIAARSRAEGNDVVVVVSAMGDTTNRLLRMANALGKNPSARELDMLMTTGEQMSTALLAIALEEAGCPSRSFTGPQVGIRTDEVFGQSRIREIHCERLRQAISDGLVPIVAGFQGATENGEITTLGRGGSDITAVALAAALGADVCEFYKDVDGIFTTDPRICPSARKIDQISFDEMLELASLGAGVLHSRSVEFAKNYGIALHVRSFLHDAPGTLVTPPSKESEMEDMRISGVAFSRDEARITLAGVPDRPGIAAQVFSRIGDAGIAVDVILQNTARDGRNDISFTVTKKEFKKATALCHEIAKEIGAEEVITDEKVAKVSAVGVGMRSHTQIASRMFGALAEKSINIQMITSSEIKISVVIHEKDLEDAVRVVHDAFAEAPVG